MNIKKEQKAIQLKKIGMKIFTAMNWTVGLIFLVSACAVDSESWMPTIVCACSLAYLGCGLYISNTIEARKH